MSEQFTIVESGADLLDRIEPLWLELRKHHAGLAPLWSQEILAGSFEARRNELLSKATGGLLTLIATANGRDVGYCISTIDNTAGQIESLFVREGQRSLGIGRQMMARTMAWLDSQAVQSIGVSVIAGNDDALNFYAKCGFRSRSVRLIYAQEKFGPT